MFKNLLESFRDPLIQKAVFTGFSLILGLISATLLRRLIISLKMDPQKKQQLNKWAIYLILLLLSFFLLRIWAIQNLFSVLQHTMLNKLFWSLIAMGFIYLLLFFVRRFINSLKVDIRSKHQYRKRASYVAALVTILTLIPIWAGRPQQWATVLSVMGAGVALALHNVLLNIAGWIFILIRRPYRTGDRIELDQVRGDVIDIRLMETTLLEIGNWVDGDQSTGRVVHLPHGQIFRYPLYNYTMGFEYIWNELSILVTFESNWQKAKEILLKLGEEESAEIQEKVQSRINRMARDYLIYYRKFTPIVYTKIEESGVKLILRFLTEAKSRRMVEDNIYQKILIDVGKAKDIDFAYPTYRITGKSGNN